MIVPRELRLQNIVSYRKATIDLSAAKTTVVYGRNLDCGNAKNNNGSGKSLLMRQIPLLRFRNPVLDTGKRSVRSTYTKDSSVELDFELTHTQDNFLYTYSCSGGKKFDILRNGKSSKIRTQGYAQETIQKLMPMSEEEFYSLYYLDARRPSLLQMGKEAARLDFFTQMFRLDDFDDLRRLFASDMKDLQGEQRSLKEVSDILDRMKGRITINIEEVLKEQAELEASFAKMDVILGRKREELDKLRTVSVLLPALKRMTDLVERSGDIKSWLVQLEKNINNSHRCTQKKLSVKREWVSYHESYDRAYSRRSSFSKEAKEIINQLELSLEDWKANKEEWLSAATTLKLEKRELSKISQSLIGFDRELNEEKTEEELRSLIEDAAQQIASEEAHQKNYLRFLKLSQHVNETDAQCPLCKSEVSKGILEELTSDTKDKLEVSESTVAKLKKRLSSLNARLEVVVTHREQSIVFSELKAKKKLVAGIAESIPTEDQFEGYQRIEVLLNKRSAIVLPTEPGIEDTEETEEELQALVDKYSGFRHDLQFIQKSSHLLDDSESFTETDLQTLEEAVTKYSQKLNTIHEKIFANRSLISQYQHDQDQIDELETRSTDIASRLEDLPIYEMLAEAYSNRGLKRIVVQNIAKRIEDNMNRYSHLLNREKVVYRIEVNPTTIDILAERPTGTSDVCELSGAESRVFNFLVPLSILSMVPDRQRLGMLIIDEPVTNMDDTLKDKFINEFLPSVSTIVPSIILLEPGTVRYKADRIITAVRKNGITTLEERIT